MLQEKRWNDPAERVDFMISSIKKILIWRDCAVITLLRRTIDVLGAAPDLEALVVSPDPDVLAIAAEAGVDTLRQRGQGLNQGLREARDVAIARGAPRRARENLQGGGSAICFQRKPRSFRGSAQLAGSRGVRRINVWAVSCGGFRPLMMAVVMSYWTWAGGTSGAEGARLGVGGWVLVGFGLPGLRIDSH